MKKVILSAAVVLAAINANAQTAEWTPDGGQTEDQATIVLSTLIPSWIDINPDGPSNLATVNLYTITGNTDGFNTLDDGWDLGSLAMAISASRHTTVGIKTNGLNGPGGDLIAPNRLSAMIAKTGTTSNHINVNEAAWTVAPNFTALNLNYLLTTDQLCFGSTTGGGHNIQFTTSFAAYKGYGHNQAHFYQDNLSEGTYTGSVMMTATLLP